MRDPIVEDLNVRNHTAQTDGRVVKQKAALAAEAIANAVREYLSSYAEASIYNTYWLVLFGRFSIALCVLILQSC